MKVNKLKSLWALSFLTASIYSFGQFTISKTVEQSQIGVTGTAEKEVISNEIRTDIIKYEKKVADTIQTDNFRFKNTHIKR